MSLKTKLSFDKDKGLIKMSKVLIQRTIWECQRDSLKTLKTFDLSDSDEDDIYPTFKRFYSSVSASFNVKPLHINV